MVSLPQPPALKTAPQIGGDGADLASASLRAGCRIETLGDARVELPPSITIPLESVKTLMRTDRAKGIELLTSSVQAMNADFPPEERSSLTKLIRAMDNGNYDILVMRQCGIIKGVLHQMVLDTPDHGRVVAIPYIWASEATRGQGVGSQLCQVGEHTARALGAWARIAEVNDREIMSRREIRNDGGSIKVSARERFWEKGGFQQLDMPYLQPKLTTGAIPVTYSALMMQILSAPPRPEMINRTAQEVSVDRNAVLSIVSAYHDQIRLKPGDLPTGKTIQDDSPELLRRVLDRGREKIPLISPREERSLRDPVFRSLRYKLQL